MEEFAQIVIFLIAGAVYLFAQLEKQKKEKQRREAAGKNVEKPQTVEPSRASGRERAPLPRSGKQPQEVVIRRVTQGKVPAPASARPREQAHHAGVGMHPAEWREPVQPKPKPVSKRAKRAVVPQEKERDTGFLVFSDDPLINGIVLSEILQPPVSMRSSGQARGVR